MNWPAGWYVLENGMGLHLPEARPCSCGEPTKAITRDGAWCPWCKARALRGRVVTGVFDCETGEILEVS